MKRIAAIAFGFALLGSAAAQLALPGNTPTRSSSGQFVVYGQPPGALPPRLARLAPDTNYVVLDPALMVVSCERIKQKLWRELGATASWRGKIYLDLYPARSADDAVTVGAEKFKGSWMYRVTLPNLLGRDRFIRTMVQVVLLEMANRSGGARPAEIPAWLVEGLARGLRATGEMELILMPPNRSVNGLAVNLQVANQRWSNPLEQAWKELRARPALTFEQLSWPSEEQLNGQAGVVYRSSAQLFVNRLLSLENGRICCRTMVEGLPRYLNWQLAFQDAFRPHFQSPLDVEKWWALQVVQFTGRDLTQTWTLDESWRRFEEIIRSPVEVRAGENELPLHAEVSLQTIVREWERTRQAQTLQRKVAEIDMARPRLVPDLVPLLDDYRGTIRNYLRRRNESVGILYFRKRQAWIYDRLAEQTIQQLDALDGVRAALRTSLPVAAVSSEAQIAQP